VPIRAPTSLPGDRKTRPPEGGPCAGLRRFTGRNGNTWTNPVGAISAGLGPKASRKRMRSLPGLLVARNRKTARIGVGFSEVYRQNFPILWGLGVFPVRGRMKSGQDFARFPCVTMLAWPDLPCPRRATRGLGVSSLMILHGARAQIGYYLGCWQKNKTDKK